MCKLGGLGRLQGGARVARSIGEMPMNTPRLTALAAAALMLAGSAILLVPVLRSAQAGERGSPLLIQGTRSDSLPVRGSVEFGFRFLNAAADRAGAGNTLISPLSAYVALGMVQSGAGGDTHAELARALGASGATRQQLDAANTRLARSLRESRGVELRMANSLWAREGVPFTDAYLTRMRSAYAAEVTALDLSSPGTMRRINQWVESQTRGKISRLLERPLSPDDVMMLINAVYFRGDWKDAFDSSATAQRPFHGVGGTRPVQMMRRQASYRYHRGDGFQLVRIPYRGDELAMYVVLPDSGRDVAELRRQLSAESWQRWTSAARNMPVILSLPRFRADVETDLIPVLGELGVNRLFDPAGADLSGMLSRESLGGRNAYVSGAMQRSLMEVDETGTVAAAVTAITVTVTSAPPPPPHMLVDRPFLVVIQDDRSGVLLFAGQIGEP
jgi:serine protease inhibitor